MEALHQKYKDRLNFLYMYVREAHPDPNTAPCGSTADLGWNHPSRDTVTIEERAQRTRWLKNDFNLTFPYIIDQMSGALQSVYQPYGFYVGWFIDCDRRVQVFEGWAWATPETQWCHLPLADVLDLESFLDTYLANPPPCYRGVSQATTTVIPAVASLDGTGGTVWVSDATVANPHTVPVGFELTYLARDRDNTEAPTRQFSVGPGESMALDDVVRETFQTTGSGALLVRSEQPLVTVSRTFNDTPEGAFGQFIAGFDQRSAVREGQVGHLLMLEESGAFRSNFGLVNLSSFEVVSQVRFIDALSTDLGTLDFTLPPRGTVQSNRVLRELTDLDLAGVRAEVRVLSPDGRVMPYASVVDNLSGDPTFIDTRLNTHAIDIMIPAAARLAGANQTTWASDLLIHNARSSQVRLTVRQLVRDMDNSNAETAELTLPAGESRLINDALFELFDDSGAAALAITADDGLMATSRTFNDADSGTFGQLVPGMDPSDDTTLRPGRLGHLAQLEQSEAPEGRRTNLGLVNLIGETVQIVVRFYSADGAALGDVNVQIPPFGYRQINRVLSEIGIDEAINVRAEIEVSTEDGRVLAYASTIDNRTGDPIFQTAWTHD